MKIKLIISMIPGLFGLSGIGFATEAFDPSALEPCINGEVSASGMYQTQAEEDTALAESKGPEQSRKGQVSVSGDHGRPTAPPES